MNAAAASLAIPEPVKSATAFKTISEVSVETGIPQHILRFWEARFPQLRPLKRGGNRRYYRPEDVALLKRIQGLLHDEGYTIKGVQKVLREQPARVAPALESFLRTRQAVAAGAGQRISLDIETLESPLGHARALRRLLDDLRQFRDSLDDA